MVAVCMFVKGEREESLSLCVLAAKAKGVNFFYSENMKRLNRQQIIIIID